LFAQRTRIPTSARSIGFCAIWVCISSSSSSHLKHFCLVDDGGKATTFSEWATLAQDRAGWLKLVAKVPFGIGKPQLRPPQCDTRVMPEEKRRFLARRAQETEQRRALFNAETDAEGT